MSPESGLRGRVRSFAHAGAGIVAVLRTQPNARIHLLAAVAAVTLGLRLGLGRTEWCWIAVSIALVWVAECLNTALESLADALTPDAHPLVARAKDAAAGAVLLAALGAVAIGLLVLGPHLLDSLAGRSVG